MYDTNYKAAEHLCSIHFIARVNAKGGGEVGGEQKFTRRIEGGRGGGARQTRLEVECLFFQRHDSAAAVAILKHTAICILTGEFHSYIYIPLTLKTQRGVHERLLVCILHIPFTHNIGTKM